MITPDSLAQAQQEQADGQNEQVDNQSENQDGIHEADRSLEARLPGLLTNNVPYYDQTGTCTAETGTTTVLTAKTAKTVGTLRGPGQPFRCCAARR